MEKGKKKQNIRRKPSFVSDNEKVWVPGMESPQSAGEYRKTLAEAKVARVGVEREEKVKEFLQMLVADVQERQKKAKKGEVVVIRPKNIRAVNEAFKEKHEYGAGIAFYYLKKNGYLLPVKTGVLGFSPKALEMLGLKFAEVPSEPELGEEEEQKTVEAEEELEEP